MASDIETLGLFKMCIYARDYIYIYMVNGDLNDQEKGKMKWKSMMVLQVRSWGTVIGECGNVEGIGVWELPSSSEN